MAGAGSAAMLVNESTILNPSSIVFSKSSTLSVDRAKQSLNQRSDDRSGSFKEGLHEGILITDTSSVIRGGVNYIYQNEKAGKRTTYSASLASTFTPNTAFGFILKNNTENSATVDDEYIQLDFGYTHILQENLILALVVDDFQQKVSDYFQYTIGVFYTLNEFIDIMADIGSGDVENREKESFNKWAIQVQSFERVFLRYGRFHDKLTNTTGQAYGVSWVGPKFSLDYALKISENIGNNSDMLFDDEQISESSFALTVLF